MKAASWIFVLGFAAAAVACGSDDSSGGAGGGGGTAGSGTGGTAGSGTGGASGSGTGGAAGSGTGGAAGSGTGGAAGSGTGGAAGGGGAGGASPCVACIGTQCGTEAAACEADADCKAIFECVASTCSPSDQTCLQACVAKNPNGASKFTALAVCVQSKCASDCS